MALTNTPPLVHGFVTGRFLIAVADTIDDTDRYLDYQTTTGTISFKPVVEIHGFLGTDGATIPTTIVRTPILVSIDSEGYIIDGTGERGIWLAAGRYDLFFQFEGVSVPGFPIEVTGEYTEEYPLDLTIHAPIPVAPGEVVVVNEAIALRAEYAADVAVESAEIATFSVSNIGVVIEEAVAGGDYQGLSAYEVAVSEGFVGSKTQWLSSLKGAKGDIGLQGVRGDKGDTGSQGPQGVQGVMGPQGATGPSGPQGLKGDTGSQGPAGPAGLEWRGNWSASVDYVNDDAVFYNGSSWFAFGDPPMGNVPSESSSYWNPLALRGIQGAKGDTGTQGPAGAKGDQGVAGPQGLQGVEGPQGPQGLVGPTGSTGPAGANGADGVGVMGGRIFVQQAEPTSPVAGDIWIW